MQVLDKHKPIANCCGPDFNDLNNPVDIPVGGNCM